MFEKEIAEAKASIAKLDRRLYNIEMILFQIHHSLISIRQNTSLPHDQGKKEQDVAIG